MMKIYPCGYSAQSLQIAELMQTDPTLLLIDLRASPNSRMPIWKRSFLIDAYGDRYGWFGETLGNVNYKNGGPIRLANPVEGIAYLVDLLQQSHNLLLLCGCAHYETCHRRIVVELLQERLPDLEVLQPDQVERPGMLKCISTRQPWAWLITHPQILVELGIPVKDIENRGQSTSYRGDLLIHTGKVVDEDLFSAGRLTHWYWQRKFGHAGEALYDAMPKRLDDYPRGAIVGRAELTDVVVKSNSLWFNGPYGLVLSHAVALSPIAYPGQLKIFDVPVSVVQQSVI
jgi:hypothetical protein